MGSYNMYKICHFNQYIWEKRHGTAAVMTKQMEQSAIINYTGSVKLSDWAAPVASLQESAVQ